MAAIVAGAFGYYALFERSLAVQKAAEAVSEKNVADAAKKDAIAQKTRADQRAAEATEQKQRADAAKKDALTQKGIA